MSSFTQVPIFGFDKGGLVKYYKPLLLENDGFQKLENAYIYRGKVQKRLGNELVGRLTRTFVNVPFFKVSASPWSFNIKTITGYVSNADNANPGQITTKYAHNLQNNDLVVLSDVVGAVGYNNPANNPFTVTVIDDTNFTIGKDATLYGAYTSGGFFISNRSLTSIEPNSEIICGSVEITLKNSPNIVITDNGDGTLTSVTAGNYGYINYVTGAVYLIHTATVGVDVDITYSYAPSLPVMGIRERELAGINDEQAIFFDTKYAYTYSSPNFVEFLPGTIWDSTNSAFFWTENYRGSVASERLFFETNFISNASNPMRYTDGATWTDFAPVVSVIAGPTNIVMFTARILISYYGRLLAFNTYEGVEGSGAASATNYFNRCRFSQIGSPVASDAWRSDQFGKGGFIDAPTNEEIISVAYTKNTLIVFFEQTTWQLRYVGEYGLPFIWERISSDFGAESTFSPIVFNDQVLAVGDKAIIAVNATDAQRIDLSIPDFVFNDIENGNDGPKRVYGVRDYQKELVYWTYTNANTQRIFQNNVLVYNYRNNTYANFRDNVTCFGTLQLSQDITWDSLVTFWDDDNVLWDSSEDQSQFPRIVSGNAQGFIHYYGYVTADEPSLSIQNINRALTPPVLTSPNHNLLTGDIIKLTDLHFVDTATYLPITTSLNDQYFQVRYLTADTFSILKWDGSSYIDNFSYTPANGTGTYMGCGKITLVPKMVVQTKDFNPFQAQGYQTKASYFDLCTTVPQSTLNETVAYTMQINVNSSPAAVANMITGNKQIESSTTPVFYVPVSEYAWHRFFATCNGQFFNITFTYDDELMNLDSTHTNDWGLYGITLYCKPAGRNTF